MKTINSNLKTGNKLNFLPKLTLLVLSILFLSVPKLGFGQAPACNYLLSNGSACDVIITIVFHDAGGPCHTISNYSLLSSQQYYANCASCSTLTNVVVTCTKVGVTNTNGTVDISSTAPFNFPSTCLTGGVDMEWHPNSTDFINN